jgi:putative transposase
MPRIARAVAVGIPHHVTQRGNYRQVVFGEDGDYQQYLEWLKYYSARYSLKIWAYCLMNNHVHFVVVPEAEDSMARVFNTLHMRYSQYYNGKQDSKGHLWQGRYYSCALDEKHLYAAVRYVENNPVKTGVVKKAENYAWSSAKGHVRGAVDSLLDMNCFLIGRIREWSAYLEERDDELTITALRENTKTGRPCGDDRFIRKIEEAIGRRLEAMPRGRPRKGE